MFGPEDIANYHKIFDQTPIAFAVIEVRQDDRGSAVDLQDRHDVLQEVELLVRRRDDEVLPLDLGVLAHLPSVRADHG